MRGDHSWVRIPLPVSAVALGSDGHRFRASVPTLKQFPVRSCRDSWQPGTRTQPILDVSQMLPPERVASCPACCPALPQDPHVPPGAAQSSVSESHRAFHLTGVARRYWRFRSVMVGGEGIEPSTYGMSNRRAAAAPSSIRDQPESRTQSTSFAGPRHHQMCRSSAAGSARISVSGFSSRRYAISATAA